MMKGINNHSFYTADMIKSNTIGAELGVWRGESSSLFLEKSKELHLVDSWSIEPYKKSDGDEFLNYEKYLARYSEITGGKEEKDFISYYDKIYESVVEKFKDNDNVFIYRMTTDEFFEKFLLENKKLDWIYVDASHEYNQVKKDLYNCLKIVKDGGEIFGDDFHESKPQVKQAVIDFIKETDLPFRNYYANQYKIKL